MPIYEFYCEACNTIFNFYSRRIDTSSLPQCPRCRKRKLQRQVSLFAATGHAREGDGNVAEDGMPPIDDARMERAVETLASEAEHINENDPRQAAQLMRKFSKMTGMEFGKGMEEAMHRMEAGENPEQVEKELGDAIEKEEPFIVTGAGKKRAHPAPQRDVTLYEM